MSEPVLDLDLAAEPPPTRLPRRRRRRRQVAALVVGVLVAALLTGPDRAPRLDLGWQLGLSTAYAWLGTGAVYTLDSVGGHASLTAHRLGDGTVRWRVPLRGPLADAYGVGTAALETRFPPHLDDGVRTYVSWGDVEHPGLTFPAVAMPMVYLTADLAVIVDRDTAIAPAAGYPPVDQAAGLPWTHQVTAVDLATGVPRWTRTIPPGVRWSLPGVRPGTTGLVGLPAGAAWMVTSSATGAVRVWDLESGAVTAERDAGPLGLESYVLALPDAVLMWRRVPTGPTIELLDPRTLVATARFAPVVPDAEPVACAPAICLYANGGLVVVDTTGAVTARLNATRVRPGPAGKVVVTAFGTPMSIVDTNGHRVTTRGGWRLVDVTDYTPAALLARGGASGQVDLGLLDVATGAVRPLGPADLPLAGARCQLGPDRLVCVVGRQLTLWRLAIG